MSIEDTQRRLAEINAQLSGSPRSLVPPNHNGRTDRPASGAAFHRNTGVGNAERFAEQHGDVVRFVSDWATWIVWDGKRWAVDTEDVQVTALATETANRIYDELDLLKLDLQAAVDDDQRKLLQGAVNSLIQHARKSATGSGIREMLFLAKGQPHIAIASTDLDADLTILNTPSGIVDLRTGELQPHNPAALCTRITQAGYDPNAEAPFWEHTLDTIFEHDADRIRWLQRIFGLAQHGNPGERLLPVVLGPGRNGKTTLCETVVAALGDYASTADGEALLLARRGGGTGANEHLADLQGRRLVVVPELPKGRLDTVRAKKLTGGDSIQARRLYGHLVEFRPSHTFIVFANDLPAVGETGIAIWDRLCIVSGLHVFDEREQLPRKEVERRLAAEAEGVLAWLIRGAVDYHHNGLGEPPEHVRSATNEYRSQEDVLGEFLDERTIADPSAWIPIAELHKAYVMWCVDSGHAHHTKVDFGRELTKRGFAERKVKNKRGRDGIRLEGTIA